MNIVITYDSSVTSLGTTLRTEFEGAVQTAVNYYDNLISNVVTVKISFGWGEVAGNAIDAGALGESNAFLDFYGYSQLLAAMTARETTSAVQRAAIASLPLTDPTHGATFSVNTAEARVLGLPRAGTGTDGSVGLESSATWSWAQTTIAAGAFDAVSVLEHEISEVMGRSDTGGANGQYSPLDLFRYTAANGLGSDAPGAATGARDEPFASGYSASANSYFSYNGTNVTLPYNTPTDIANGNDVADWGRLVSGDSCGFGTAGQTGVISSADLQELNVLGYTLVACFAGGTRILTARGEIPVEQLRPGDRVPTTAGRLAPISWIGHRQVKTRSHPRPWDIMPVRVAAGAFAPGQPLRDLLLSPDHAVLADGHLVPVRYLLNGATISRETVSEVTYWHVELDRHAALFADGLPAESYLDTGNRGAFAGESEVVLHADFSARSRAIWRSQSYAPLLHEGPALAALRHRLLGRAGGLGHRRVTDPELRPRIADGFLWLTSRHAVPAETAVENPDARRLGVAVARIKLDGAELRLDDPRLNQGWHAPEPGLRWTDGMAIIAIGDAARVEITLAATAITYWADQPLETSPMLTLAASAEIT